MEVGGLKLTSAGHYEHVDRSTERDIFDELNMKNPQLAEDVRKLMFVFEDIAYLDPLSVQRFLREIDSKDLSVALKVANRDVTAPYSPICPTVCANPYRAIWNTFIIYV